MNIRKFKRGLVIASGILLAASGAVALLITDKAVTTFVAAFCSGAITALLIVQLCLPRE